jgi:hypothetical protein
MRGFLCLLLPLKGAMIVKNDVNRMFLYYKEKAGIRKPSAVHEFARPSSATSMVSKGCDMNYLDIEIFGRFCGMLI